jgi:2-polyprenyl-6-methoxyphenol hydroxylase-like FAD-dependent oxidoreductase
MNPKVADVVIVGARCAGTALARLLADAGLRVIVFERSARGADTLSTHALMRGAVAQLSKWGLIGALEAAGTPLVRRTTFIYNHEPLAIDIEPRDGIEGLYAPRRTVLDTVLADAASAAGVAIHYRHRVVGILRDDEGRVGGVEVLDAADRRSEVRARWVVGADGLHSTVATLVQAPVVRQATHSAAVLYAHWPGVSVDGFRWYFEAGLSAGTMPTNDGKTCVFLSTPIEGFRDRFHGRLDVGYRQALSQAAPEVAEQLPEGLPPEGYRGFGGHAGQARRSHGPGWALVGDAAEFRDPITAHGITDALRDAEAIARALVTDSPAGWQEYIEQHLLLATPIAVVSDRIASFDWTIDELRDLHVQLSRAMGREARAIVARR